MNKIFFALIFLLIGSIATAQLQKPTGKPGQKPLAIPHIQKLTAPDLQITAIRLVRSELNSSTKLHTVTVSISIKNNGQATAVASQLKAFSQNVTRSESMWSGFGEPVAVTAINGGATITAEYVFHESPRVVSTSSFKFKVVADTNNTVAESNETNNTSSVINVTDH